MMRVILVLLALTACDKLPERPSEATFKEASDYEQCRLAASRAILCTDEIMVEELRAIPGLEGAGDLAEVVEEGLANDKPRTVASERADRIKLHKASCLADPKYAGAVFSCWAIEDCKKFAACVAKPPAAPR
jgi:hypothetical protein